MPTKQLEIELLKGAQAPTKGSLEAAGYDLYSYHDAQWGSYDYSTQYVSLGVKIKIPKGYCGLLLPRSSLHKRGLTIANNVGLIDSDYRGEIKMALQNTLHGRNEVKVGDRLVQLVIMPVADTTIKIVDNVGTSVRGAGGFGSTNYEY